MIFSGIIKLEYDLCGIVNNIFLIIYYNGLLFEHVSVF